METWLEKRIKESDVKFENYTKEIVTTPRKRMEKSIRNACRAGIGGAALAQVFIRIYTESKFPMLEICLVIVFFDFVFLGFGGFSIFEPIVFIYNYVKDKKIKEPYPCKDCLIISTCTDFCHKIEKDLETIVTRFDREECCIDCGSETCHEIFHTIITSTNESLGQHGPDIIECTKCGHHFHFDKLVIQRMQHYR
jgi:hypothetical protein